MTIYRLFFLCIALVLLLYGCDGDTTDEVSIQLNEVKTVSSNTTERVFASASSRYSSMVTMQWFIDQPLNDENTQVYIENARCDFTATQNTHANPIKEGVCAADIHIGALAHEDVVILRLVAVNEAGYSTSKTMRLHITPYSSDLSVSLGADGLYKGDQAIERTCEHSGGFWYDPANTNALYHWEIYNLEDILARDLWVELDADAEQPSAWFTLPSVARSLDVIIRCTVTDNLQQRASAHAVLRVVPRRPLVVNSGQSITAGPGDTVSFSGQIIDPENLSGPYYHQWLPINDAASSIRLSGANTLTPSFRAPFYTQDTLLLFELRTSREPIAEHTIFAASERSQLTVFIEAE